MTAFGSRQVYRGDALRDEQIAAISAAVAALLDEEGAARPADPVPAVYRSAWRSEGIRDALDAGTVR
jgi:hypothetical protein